VGPVWSQQPPLTGLLLESFRPEFQVTVPAAVPPIPEMTLKVCGPAPCEKSTSPSLMVRCPAPLLTSMLFRSMNPSGWLLIPVLTLTNQTPMDPLKVTQLMDPHGAPTIVTVLVPSKRERTGVAEAGGGPISMAAQLNTTAQPIAITAFVSFMTPPGNFSVRLKRLRVTYIARRLRCTSLTSMVIRT